MIGNPILPMAKSLLAVALVACLAGAPGLVSAQGANGPKPAAAPKPAVPIAAKAGEAGKELVAVMDLEAVGASSVQASAMSDRMREELLKTGKYTLVDRAQMNAVLDEQALQQTGCTSQECAVKVGKVLGVRKLVTGKITKLGDTQWLLSATMTDVETAETLRAESLRYKGDYFSMIDDGIVTLVGKLSAPVAGRPDMAAYLAAQQPAPGAAAPEQKSEEGKGISGWWWVAGGAAALGLAAAAGSKSSKSSSSASSCANCGKVGVGW